MHVPASSVSVSVSVSVLLAAVCCVGVHAWPAAPGQLGNNEKVLPVTRAQPWPMPASFQQGATVVPLKSEGFQFLDLGSGGCDVLVSAFKRYRGIIFGEDADTSLKFRPRRQLAGEVAALEVTSKGGCTEKLNLESDESYKLSITAGKAQITANETWGVLRGLETFAQIVYRGEDGQFVVNETEVDDRPLYAHRGVLLDTARHYLRKEFILQNLDAMATNKMNVFHWHIVDNQAFPFVSLTFPQLSAQGAYKPVENHIYTPEDVNDVINYAYQRGIRTMVEFDTPGHVFNAWQGQPDLLTPCYDSHTNKPNGVFGPVNPILNSTYDFMAKLLTEVAGRFPDDYIFLGGDEVSFGCWKSNPDITAFMKKMGFGTNYGQLEQYYIQKILDIVAGLNKKYVVWQEVIDNGAKVNQDTVVGVWINGLDEVAKVTALGHRVLYCTPFYLNYYNNPYSSQQWQRVYETNMDFNGTAQQKSLMIGSESTMWAEFVDGSNVIHNLWPNTAAVAEALWSPGKKNATEAAARFGENRCRFIKRGIRAEPARGPGFCEVEI